MECALSGKTGHGVLKITLSCIRELKGEVVGTMKNVREVLRGHGLQDGEAVSQGSGRGKGWPKGTVSQGPARKRQWSRT